MSAARFFENGTDQEDREKVAAKLTGWPFVAGTPLQGGTHRNCLVPTAAKCDSYKPRWEPGEKEMRSGTGYTIMFGQTGRTH